jgi:hypothetical protein
MWQMWCNLQEVHAECANPEHVSNGLPGISGEMGGTTSKRADRVVSVQSLRNSGGT